MITPAVRDLPPFTEDPNLLGLEMHRRDEYDYSGPSLQGEPWDNPLLKVQENAPEPDSKEMKAFSTTIANFEGFESGSSPPDDTGDVGPNHFVQGINSANSTVRVFNKSGTTLATFTMETLGAGLTNCSNGFCDPIILYDQIADRWVVSEFAGRGSYFCVYVSQTGDPTGSYYAYEFPAGYTSYPDYPKYGVWPQDDDGDGIYDEGSYLIGVNAGASGYRDVFALDRDAMLQGLTTSPVKFSIPDLPAFSFELLLPANHEGNTPPPNNTPALFLRPVDNELHSGYACSEPCDIMDIWSLTMDWDTPANSTLTHLPNIEIAEYDHTLCGTSGNWDCMPQPGTTQKIDPIREPIHFPLQYRNFGDHETLVGCFAEDVDGTDHAAVHWFEIRNTGSGWDLHQDGVIGGDARHRSVCSAAMDQSGNIAVGYTRTGSTAPYYPSIYYAGRLSSDPTGTMPYYEYVIQDATTSKTNNERWGDYSGIGVDPADDCTFWYTTEYGGTGHTKIAAFKFDACGCVQFPSPPTASASAVQPDRIDVSWDDSDLDSVVEYRIYRSTTSTGPYTLVNTVTDTSPGVANSGTYTYQDTPLASGQTYYYVVDASDGLACISEYSDEVSATLYGTNIVFDSIGTWTELTGNMDGFLNQGEKWSVDVTLRNDGNLDATNVTAILTGNGITLCASPGTFGAIDQGGSDLKTFTYTFIIISNFSIGNCPGDITFNIITKTSTEQTPAGVDESNVFSATVASGGMTVNDATGATGTIASKTTTNFFTVPSPVISTPGVLSACTMDISMIPPGYSNWTLSVIIDHDPGNDGTYDFTQTIFSGTVAGWTNISGFALTNMVNGSNIGNGTWRLRITNNGQGPNNSGTLQSWTLHLTSGSWDCSYVGSGDCGGVTPAPEVSDDDLHYMTVDKNGDDVDLTFEDVGASHYNIYVSTAADTHDFLVSLTDDGKADCGGLDGATDNGEMLTFSGYSLENGLTGDTSTIYFLVTADNGVAGSEGPLGEDSETLARSATENCP